MKTVPAEIGILLLIATVAGVAQTTAAAELRVIHRRHHYRYAFWRIGPQQCFLTPDEVVMLDALGPYCSSPRGHYYRLVRRW
jgi:hypothetical protein